MAMLCVSEFELAPADVKKFIGWLEEYKIFALASGNCQKIEYYHRVGSDQTICMLEYWDSVLTHAEINVRFTNESDVPYSIVQTCTEAVVQKKYLLQK